MRRSFAPFLWIFVLAAIPAAYYGWYFLGQRQRIAELNQRELGRAAENLRAILDIAKTNVRNTAGKPEFSCRLTGRHLYLAMPSGVNCEDYAKFPKREKAEPVLSVDKDGITVAAADLKFQMELDKVLDELVVGDEFEYLFVAADTGEVIFQTRRGERKRWADNLRWADHHVRDETARPDSPLRLENVSQLIPRGNDQPDFHALVQTTNSLNVKVAGEDHRLYLQPLLTGTSSAAADSKGLVLGGLVNTRTSFNDALAVDPQFALFLAVLAGVALVTWPLLKLAVLAPGERFKSVDAHLLLLSGSALLGVCTVVLLELDNSHHIASIGSARLKLLANELAGGLEEELSAAAGQVSAFDREVTGLAGADCDKKLQRVKLLEAPATSGQLPLRAPEVYPQPVAAFWVLPNGEQFAKATPAEQNTPFVNVSKRPYFQAALDGHLWSLPENAKHAYFGEKFFTQTYRSITTGEFETGLSIRSGVCTAKSEQPNVAVVTTTLASLAPKALPSDYGFMLIDRTGRVLYHSDPRRALREDIFEEVDEPARLRAMIATESETYLAAKYRTGPHEFFVRPFHELQVASASGGTGPRESAGWFILTFRDLQFSQTANGEAGVTALVWFTTYFVLFQFAPALVFILLAPRRNEWMWPDTAKLGLYHRVTATLVLLAASSIIGLMMARGWMLAVVSCVAGAAAIIATFWEYHLWSRGRQPLSTPAVVIQAGRANNPRAVCIALLLTLVSILPAAGFFKLAWNQEFGALLAYEARHRAEKAQDLTSEIVNRAHDQFAAVYGERHPRVESFLRWEEAYIPWKSSPVNASDGKGLVDPLAAWKPVYNDAAAALRYEKPDSRLILSGWDISMRPGLFALFGGLALIAMVLGWIRFWGKHLFLANIDDGAPSVADIIRNIEALRQQGRSVIVVTTSQAQQEQFRRMVAGNSARAAAAVGNSGLPAAPGLHAEDDIVELGCDLRLIDSRREALARLEQMAGKAGGIVLSRVDPGAHLFPDANFDDPEGAAEPPSSEAAPDEWERRRWSDVLERFSFVLLPPEPARKDVPPVADSIGSAAGREHHFRCLWESCTKEEKIVLVHVADEGFANPRQNRTTERLLRRGLLVKRPDLRLFDSEFARFVRESYDRKTMRQWEHPGGLGWGQARWMLTVLVIGLIVFLVGTQRQVLTPAVSFVSTLAGALAGVVKLVGDLSPKKQALP